MGGTTHDAKRNPAPIWSRRPMAFAVCAGGRGPGGGVAADGPSADAWLLTKVHLDLIVTLTLLRHAEPGPPR